MYQPRRLNKTAVWRRWMLGDRPRVNHWPAGTYGPHPTPEMAAFFFDVGAGERAVSILESVHVD